MFYYQINCVGVTDGDLINNMKELAVPITYRTFRKNVDKDSFLDIEKEIGYRQDFRMLNDWHVGFFKSEIKGHPVYYFVWSGIEHIFTKKDFPTDLFFQEWTKE